MSDTHTHTYKPHTKPLEWVLWALLKMRQKRLNNLPHFAELTCGTSMIQIWVCLIPEVILLICLFAYFPKILLPWTQRRGIKKREWTVLSGVFNLSEQGNGHLEMLLIHGACWVCSMRTCELWINNLIVIRKLVYVNRVAESMIHMPYLHLYLLVHSNRFWLPIRLQQPTVTTTINQI